MPNIREIETFRNEKELIDKIRYYIAHPYYERESYFPAMT